MVVVVGGVVVVCVGHADGPEEQVEQVSSWLLQKSKLVQRVYQGKAGEY